MIKGDVGKESFVRAQGKYLYQCEVKASHCWCQAAGIFIVYKLLLLQLGFGRKGSKERAVPSKQVWILIRQFEWVEVLHLYIPVSHSIMCDHRLLWHAVDLPCWSCPGTLWKLKRCCRWLLALLRRQLVTISSQDLNSCFNNRSSVLLGVQSSFVFRALPAWAKYFKEENIWPIWGLNPILWILTRSLKKIN